MTTLHDVSEDLKETDARHLIRDDHEFLGSHCFLCYRLTFVVDGFWLIASRLVFWNLVNDLDLYASFSIQMRSCSDHHRGRA